MHVTITKLRQDLFRLMDRALEGEPVQFTHKGVVFRVVPETAPDKLSRLARQTVVASGGDPPQAGKDLLEEMEAEWQRDWAEL
jgi:prevent-host-death family protein